MTTIRQLCDICTEEQRKLDFVSCGDCLNSLCKDCSNRVDRCPSCRAQPMTRLTLKPNSQNLPTPPQPVPITNTTNQRRIGQVLTYWSTIQTYFQYNTYCGCRSGCKHTRCNCIAHNYRFEARQLQRIITEARNSNTLIDTSSPSERDAMRTLFNRNSRLGFRTTNFMINYQVKDPKNSHIHSKLETSLENILEKLDLTE